MWGNIAAAKLNTFCSDFCLYFTREVIECLKKKKKKPKTDVTENDKLLQPKEEFIKLVKQN